MDLYNAAPLAVSPAEALTQGLMLKYKPVNLDVLPIYVVFMSAFPPVLWLMLRHRNWVMLASVLLYFSARHFDWNFPSYPSGVWYFNRWHGNSCSCWVRGLRWAGPMRISLSAPARSHRRRDLSALRSS
jgi:hypothetical protein